MIFENLNIFVRVWNIKSTRELNSDELSAIDSATVVPGDYGQYVQFILNNGERHLIPVANGIKVSDGVVLSPKDLKVITLESHGEYIHRITF